MSIRQVMYCSTEKMSDQALNHPTAPTQHHL